MAMEVKEDEMGWACSTHRGNGKLFQNFSRKTSKDQINC